MTAHVETTRRSQGRRALVLASGLPIESGTLGFGLSSWHFDRFARDHVHALLGRYFGFEHSLPDVQEAMRGRTPSPSWITLLGPGLTAALGGEDALECRGERRPVAARDGHPVGVSVKFPILFRHPEIAPPGDTTLEAAGSRRREPGR